MSYYIHFIINFKGGEIIFESYKEILVHNPEPYCSIYEFINSNVIPKYPCLTHCYQANFDEEGNPRVQYYIRYATDLSLKQWDNLFVSILNDIEEYLDGCGISLDENFDVDFILTVDGDFDEEQNK